ncbi:MAG: SDR family oxidoreductase [Acidobacteria bacterium]|nr:SDR family oxidoreductase [Acidobacteriota bacterium]
MNVLVVGGAGYVGGAVTDRLLQTGSHSVRVYDSLLYETEYRKPVEFVYGDIRDQERLEGQLRWADAVIWLAAVVGDEACAADPDLTADINQQRVEWLSRHFDRRILFLSTCSVYGAAEGLLDEEAPLNPLSLYAKTKLAAEQHLRNSPAMIFRLATLFGVSDHFSRIRMDLVVNTLTARAFFHRRYSIFGGMQYRPLLHVRDAADAIVDNLTTTHAGIFNLHMVNTRIADLAAAIQRHFPGVAVTRVATASQDRRTYQATSDKARRTFGFCPSRSVDSGISEVRTLLEEHRIRDVTNRRYSNASFLKSLLEAPATPLGYELGRKI